MTMSAEDRSKLAAIHRSWWRLHMIEKFSSGTNKQSDAWHDFIRNIFSNF